MATISTGMEGSKRLVERPLLITREVEELTRMSRHQLYRMYKKGLFPRPIRRGETRFAFFKDEVQEWLANRPRA